TDGVRHLTYVKIKFVLFFMTPDDDNGSRLDRLLLKEEEEEEEGGDEWDAMATTTAGTTATGPEEYRYFFNIFLERTRDRDATMNILISGIASLFPTDPISHIFILSPISNFIFTNSKKAEPNRGSKWHGRERKCARASL
ncbi:hypothetical protein ACJX0J_041065, partial [Zea mays]